MEDYKKLKSGSDVRGTAIEGVINEPITLTNDAVYNIVRAFYKWLFQKTNNKTMKIAVGHDSRLSSESIKNIVIDALKSSGANVIDTGLSTTPSMFMTTKMINTDGAIEITASHLPFNKNGLKFFTVDGGLEGKDIDDILVMANSKERLDGNGTVSKLNFMKDYSMHLVNFIKNKTKEECPLKGLHIIVDAGNGAGGFYANDVLLTLGADISGSQFLNPDGRFPNHIPNPENKVAMESISNRVKEVKADFGIIFDTDVDRAACVDRYGNEINRNALIALISKILLDEKKGTIVTDSLTSDGLTEFIEKNGGTHHRFKRGYKNVIDESIRLNSTGEYSPLAIETSGHAALIENYFLDDGAYLMTRILVKISELKKENKDISDLIKDLKAPVEAKEIRFPFINLTDFIPYGNSILDGLKEYAIKNNLELEKKNYEGVRINFKEENIKGWLLLRLSLHDPIMPLNMESDVEGGNKKIAKILYEFLKEYEKLDSLKLKDFIGE